MKPLTKRQLIARRAKYERDMEHAIFQLQVSTVKALIAIKEVMRVKQRVCEVFSRGRKRKYTAINCKGRSPR